MEDKSIPELISQKIIKMIKDSNLKVDDKLPNEKELMELFKVSRNSLREALKILSSRNIIYIKQGSGTYVAEQTGISEDPLGLLFIKDRKKLVKDILDLRYILEPEIASLAAQNASPAQVEELEEILAKMEKQIKKKNDFLEYDQEFHGLIAKMTQNIIIAKLIPILNETIKVFSQEALTTEYENTLVSHEKLFNAIKDKKSNDAKEIMTYHILFNKERFSKERSDEFWQKHCNVYFFMVKFNKICKVVGWLWIKKI